MLTFVMLLRTNIQRVIKQNPFKFVLELKMNFTMIYSDLRVFKCIIHTFIVIVVIRISLVYL